MTLTFFIVPLRNQPTDLGIDRSSCFAANTRSDAAILVHNLNGTNRFDSIRSVAVAAKGSKGRNGSGNLQRTTMRYRTRETARR
jgi:hypothetical protein